MTVGEICTRVRYDVNDPNSEIYTAAEVQAAINNAKDEVFDILRATTSEYPQASTSIAFALGDKEKDLPSDYLSILYIEYYPTGATVPSARRVVNFRQQEYSEDTTWYTRRLATGITKLGRLDSSVAITPTIYYVPDVSDIATITTGTNSYYTFGPPPTNNLIAVKATIHLLAARNRNTSLFEGRESRLTASLTDTLRKTEQASPRYVNYDPSS